MFLNFLDVLILLFVCIDKKLKKFNIYDFQDGHMIDQTSLLFDMQQRRRKDNKRTLRKLFLKFYIF